MAIGLFALLLIFAAVIGSAAMVGVIGYLLHRIRVIEGGAAGREAPNQLLDRVTDMGDDLFAMQEQLSAMSERLDFTEKLLMSGDDEPDSTGSV